MASFLYWNFFCISCFLTYIEKNLQNQAAWKKSNYRFENTKKNAADLTSQTLFYDEIKGKKIMIIFVVLLHLGQAYWPPTDRFKGLTPEPISRSKRRRKKIKTDLERAEKITWDWHLIHGSTTKMTWFTCLEFFFFSFFLLFF